MPLFLTALRCPDGVAPEHREVTRDPFSIGRGIESDWVLPDPDRVLSKRHCRITARDDGWLVTDSSSNGTLLNGATLDADLPHLLRDRDRLAFGQYEFDVRIGDAPPDEAGGAAPRRGVQPGGLGEGRLTGDPFASQADGPLETARPSVGLPPDFGALGAEDQVEASPYAAPDHAPDLQAHFRAPRPSLELLPDDWDLEAEPASAAPKPPAQPSPAPPDPPAPVPDAGRVPPPAETQGADVAGQAGFAAFAAGAGVTGPAPADANAALRTLGGAFRAVVSGLRRIMIARSMVKGEFRIEQTMIRAAGNNPLKFSADDSDALAGLLGTGRQGGMGPEQAISEALRDMRLHELAVTAAMQRAVRDVLAELEPERVARERRRGVLDGLSGRRKASAWDAYAARHAQTTSTASSASRSRAPTRPPWPRSPPRTRRTGREAASPCDAAAACARPPHDREETDVTWHNRIVWQEGMFLRAQHFQQQDRWAAQQLRSSSAAASPGCVPFPTGSPTWRCRATCSAPGGSR